MKTLLLVILCLTFLSASCSGRQIKRETNSADVDKLLEELSKAKERFVSRKKTTGALNDNNKAKFARILQNGNSKFEKFEIDIKSLATESSVSVDANKKLDELMKKLKSDFKLLLDTIEAADKKIKNEVKQRLDKADEAIKKFDDHFKSFVANPKASLGQNSAAKLRELKDAKDKNVREIGTLLLDYSKLTVEIDGQQNNAIKQFRQSLDGFDSEAGKLGLTRYRLTFITVDLATLLK